MSSLPAWTPQTFALVEHSLRCTGTLADALDRYLDDDRPEAQLVVERGNSVIRWCRAVSEGEAAGVPDRRDVVRLIAACHRAAEMATRLEDADLAATCLRLGHTCVAWLDAGDLC